MILIKIQNYIIKFIVNILFNVEHDKPKKIAIYRFGSFGDSIVTFPTIKAINQHYKNVTIHIYNKPENDNLIKMNDLLNDNMYDKLITLKANTSIKEFYSIVKKEKYDIWFELSSAGLTLSKALKKVLFLKFCGVKSINGLEVTPNQFLAKYYKRNYSFISERERLLKHLDTFNIETQKCHLNFPLKSISENIKKVEGQLKSDNIDRKKLIVLITKSKRDSTTWSENNWINLSNQLIEKGYHLALIGAPSDSIFILPIVKKVNSQYIKSYAGIFSVLDSAALLKLSRLAISVDTGPMHLAYAVGTKVISLFSARDYIEKWYPPKELGIVIRKDIKCSPCFLDDCPISNECMNNIECVDIIQLDYIDDK